MPRTRSWVFSVILAAAMVLSASAWAQASGSSTAPGYLTVEDFHKFALDPSNRTCSGQAQVCLAICTWGAGHNCDSACEWRRNDCIRTGSFRWDNGWGYQAVARQ